MDSHGEAPAANREAFRSPGDDATLPELIKFLNDRSVRDQLAAAAGPLEILRIIGNSKA